MAGTELRYTYLSKGRYWRFRHPKTGDVPLPNKKGVAIHDQPSQSEFAKRYGELLAKVEGQSAPLDKQSFAWLIKEYKASAEFRNLSDATQLDYAGRNGDGGTLAIVLEHLGDEPFALTTRKMIKIVRDKFADTPRKAHKIKQMVSRLYSWADEEGHVPEKFNPANGLKKLKPKGGEKEYTVWSVAEFDIFMKHAIAPMRTAAMIARYTGQRVQDIGKMVWTDFQGDMIRVRQSKTGRPLMIACHTALRAYLEDLKRSLATDKRRGVLILTSVAGKPYNANSLSSAVGRAVSGIEEMPADRSLHGVRYMAGSELDEAGCTVAEIESVLGHETFRMALKYASQRLRSKAANAKLEAQNAG